MTQDILIEATIPVIVPLQHTRDVVSAYQDTLYTSIDAVSLMLAHPPRHHKHTGATYRLLSSDRHWLLYASTLTSLRNEGEAKSCTLIFPAVIVSPASTKPAQANSSSGSTVEKGTRRLLGIISRASVNRCGYAQVRRGCGSRE
jgi:hypothetical protein